MIHAKFWDTNSPRDNYRNLTNSAESSRSDTSQNDASGWLCVNNHHEVAAIDQYWHNQTGRGRLSERSDRKADSHLKRQIMGREVVVAVTKGGSTGAPGSGSSKARREGWPLSLDGRRRKQVLVNVIGQ